MISKISVAAVIVFSSLQTALAQTETAPQKGPVAQAESAAETTAVSTNKDWMNWRGPAQNGSSTQMGLPHALGEEQLQWKIELPGTGCSTPIVVGDSVYLTAPEAGKDTLVCVDDAGVKKWERSFGKEDPGRHRNGSGSNASPVSDGQGVFAYFKSGTLAAVELDGSIRWQLDLVEKYGKAKMFWSHGTSPVLTKKHIVMARICAGKSWLAAFDKQTGKLAWKVERNFKTPKEGDQGYATPLVIDYQDKGVDSGLGSRTFDAA